MEGVPEFQSISLGMSLPHLGNRVRVRVDRPLGSRHPRHGFRYELNYGHVPGTLAPDGEELDAYLIGIDVPVTELSGVCIAVIHRLNDDDDKLVVVTPGVDPTYSEIAAAVAFQEREGEYEIRRQ